MRNRYVFPVLLTMLALGSMLLYATSLSMRVDQETVKTKSDFLLYSEHLNSLENYDLARTNQFSELWRVMPSVEIISTNVNSQKLAAENLESELTDAYGENLPAHVKSNNLLRANIDSEIDDFVRSFDIASRRLSALQAEMKRASYLRTQSHKRMKTKKSRIAFQLVKRDFHQTSVLIGAAIAKTKIRASKMFNHISSPIN